MDKHKFLIFWNMYYHSTFYWAMQKWSFMNSKLFLMLTILKEYTTVRISNHLSYSIWFCSWLYSTKVYKLYESLLSRPPSNWNLRTCLSSRLIPKPLVFKITACYWKHSLFLEIPTFSFLEHILNSVNKFMNRTSLFWLYIKTIIWTH